MLVYEVASRVAAVIHGLEEIYGDEPLSDVLQDFYDYGTEEFTKRIAAPCKDTLLHLFIRNVHSSDLDYATGHDPNVLLWARLHLQLYGFPFPSWLNEEEVYDHIAELDGVLQEVCTPLAKDVFHLLYGDRKLLLRFQLHVARSVSLLKMGDLPEVLQSDGVLKRPSYLPQWLIRAVYFRDQGLCQRCGKDISGLLTATDERQLDHMVPLASAGSNDPTNFQLVCRDCNLSKGSGPAETSDRYVPYWRDTP